MQKGRLEALSDGVLAIIITIMVLQLKVPHGKTFAALRPGLPVFLGYLLSFVYVGIYWNNHYYLLGGASDIVKRPSQMPGVIAEALYLTNEEDARAVRQDKVIEALARAYAESVKQYFQRFPVS